MSSSRRIAWMVGTWIFVLVVYSAVSLSLKRGEIQLRFGYLDFVLLLIWWTFLYTYVVLPWLYATPTLGQYNHTFNLVTDIQNMVIVVGWAMLWLQSSGAWRIVYGNLFGTSAIYMLSSLTINVAIDKHTYYTGSLYDLSLLSSFLWLALA